MDPDLPRKGADENGKREEEGKRQARVKSNIDIALENLTMAFETEALIGLIYEITKR